MSNAFFQMKQFIVRQDKCAMKVGTDGTLLGAWAHGGSRVLDIGTGTGLVALMMAQRFVSSSVVAVDVDSAAVEQARENIAMSPFNERVTVVLGDIVDYATDVPFDAIVSNPPFFTDSLTSPDERRTAARHTCSLNYRDLAQAVWRLLSDEGEFSVIIPFDCKTRLETEFFLAGFFKSRECAVRTLPYKTVRRYLMAFRKHQITPEQTEGVIESSPGHRSPWYEQLTRDFYL